MKLFNWLIGNKIKTYLSLGIVVAIGGYIAYHLVNYKNAIRDAERFKTEIDKVIIENIDLTSYNASLLAKNDSTNKVIIQDKENYSKTTKELQGIINQQRLIIKEKDKYESELVKGLKCKVPQKVKVGFLKWEWRLLVVDCDSLEKTLE